MARRGGSKSSGGDAPALGSPPPGVAKDRVVRAGREGRGERVGHQELGAPSVGREVMAREAQPAQVVIEREQAAGGAGQGERVAADAARRVQRLAPAEAQRAMFGHALAAGLLQARGGEEHGGGAAKLGRPAPAQVRLLQRRPRLLGAQRAAQRRQVGQARAFRARQGAGPFDPRLAFRGEQEGDDGVALFGAALHRKPCLSVGRTTD